MASRLLIRPRWMISHRHLHTPTPQIDDGDARLRSTFDVLHQDRHLLDLLGDGVAVAAVAEKSPGVNNQVAFLGGGDAHLDAEFVGVARFALADALDFRCVHVLTHQILHRSRC